MHTKTTIHTQFLFSSFHEEMAEKFILTLISKMKSWVVNRVHCTQNGQFGLMVTMQKLVLKYMP